MPWPREGVGDRWKTRASMGSEGTETWQEGNGNKEKDSEEQKWKEAQRLRQETEKTGKGKVLFRVPKIPFLLWCSCFKRKVELAEVNHEEVAGLWFRWHNITSPTKPYTHTKKCIQDTWRHIFPHWKYI